MLSTRCDTTPAHARSKNCSALCLPPELWLSILKYFDKRENPYARRQLHDVALVCSSLFSVALPLLYSQITLMTYYPFTGGKCPPKLRTRPPTITIVQTLVSHPDLHSAVKSMTLRGNIDTVLLSRRSLTRATDNEEVYDLRNRVVSLLPQLTSLKSIAFDTIPLTSELCKAIFQLPSLEQLTLKDSRIPAPLNGEEFGGNKLMHVEIFFKYWTNTFEELQLLSSFVYGPDLKTLVTDQPRILASLLGRDDITSKLSRLEISCFREEDASFVTSFLAHPICSHLKSFAMVDCKFSQWANGSVSFPHLPLPFLQSFSGPPDLMPFFVGAGNKVQHIRLGAPDSDGHIVNPDFWSVVSSGTVKNLDILLRRESLLMDATWTMLSNTFTSLQVLRVRHLVPVEEFKTRILSKCIAMLPAMKQLEKIALVPSTLTSDVRWQSAAVDEISWSQRTLREISLSVDIVWIRLAEGEWRMFQKDEF